MDQIEITNKERKQFIKDYKLPIPIYKLPYFTYYLEQYNDSHKTKEKYELFINAIKQLKLEDKQLKETSSNIINEVVKRLKEIPEYKEFLSAPINNQKELPNDIQIYKKYDHNDPIYYISVDMITANFTVLKYFNPKIVLNCDTYNDFIKNFTDIEYFIKSKKYRQVIFGILNAKKIRTMQKFLLGELYDKIKNIVNITGRIETDELIIATTKSNMRDGYNKIIKAIDTLPENMKKIWRVTPTYIQQLGTSTCFIKKTIINLELPYDEKTNVKEEITNIEKDYYAQAYKFYKKEEIHPYDMMAMKDKYVITFEEKYEFV